MTQMSTVECPNCDVQVAANDRIEVTGMQVCIHCKDEYVQQMKEGVTPGADLERYREIRKEHVKHEASIQSIGTLYYLATLGLGLGAIGAILSPLDGGNSILTIIIAVVVGVIAVFYCIIGTWLRRLNPKAKIPTTILSVLGLLGFPIGTLINAYFLYLIHSKKGKMILSPEYTQIREATPDIKYKASILIWIFLGLLFLIIAAGVILPMITA